MSTKQSKLSGQTKMKNHLAICIIFAQTIYHSILPRNNKIVRPNLETRRKINPKNTKGLSLPDSKQNKLTYIITSFAYGSCSVNNLA